MVGIVDLPGTYTLSGSNQAEGVVFDYLLDRDFDCIINVVDASHLSLGLSLTLELLELGRPMVLVLNMIDEADHLGMRVDVPGLSKELGIPVVPMIASKGRGIQAVFTTALRVANAGKAADRPKYSPEVEEVLAAIELPASLPQSNLQSDAIKIKLLEGDPNVLSRVAAVTASGDSQSTGLPDSTLHIADERQSAANELSARFTHQGTRKLTLRDRLDDYLLHPFWGYVFLILILYVFFQAVFQFGGLLEQPLLHLGGTAEDWLLGLINPQSLLIRQMLIGLVQGITGGLAIVLPYLAPFLLGLGILEDVGYLPRLAFLMDSLMHKIGLHGGAIVPFILGFGCNVPSIMSTRTLDDKKERYIAAALATMVPCAARLSVVFGLVAFYLGPLTAMLIYLFNLLVIAITGKLLSRMIPEDTPGFILEIPPYRVPALKTVLQKAWFRVKEFLVEAWPLLIGGSVLLAMMNVLDLSKFIDMIARPITWFLGLPSQVGLPLIFGILRKELSLVMLGQALGSMHFNELLSPVQLITYTVFVIFYMPCIATLVTLHKELGKKSMWSIMGITTLIALVSATIARILATVFY